MRVFLALIVGVGLIALAAIPAGAGEAPPPGQPDLSPIPTTWEQVEGDLAIWTAVVFLLLLAVLWPFWGRIARGLEKREQRIADEIALAERSHAEARELLGQYERRLAASGEEVQQMLEAARREAERVGHQIVEKARLAAAAERQKTLGQIEEATADALKDLAEQSATLAVDLAGKIVHGRLDPKAQSRLIEQAVAQFSKGQSGRDGPKGG
jgi:F-type H+-transporting ATPase subunit b